MFEPQTSPRIFALPLGVDFASAFVSGVLDRMKGRPPEELAKITIYLNTRRAARDVEMLFCKSGALLLPNVQVVTDLGNDPLAPLNLSPAIPALRRDLIIAQLVDAFLAKEPDVAPQSAVFDLADSLGKLLDGFYDEGVSLSSLHNVETGAVSSHWARSLRFLEILADYWGNQRPNNAPDQNERQRAVVEAYAKLWEETPTQSPVIVAGSTGSRGTTRLFMEAVAKLPHGAVVLPGYDYDTPFNMRKDISADHPQAGFAALSQSLDMSQHPHPWTDAPVHNSIRNRIVSLALRPAPVTDQWLREGPPLADKIPDACNSLTLVEAPTPRFEAEAIAIRMRMAIEQNQKVALVSPDRVLTRLVSSYLRDWGIDPDDSAGTPLTLSPPGIFLRRIISISGRPLAPQDLLAVLKHPLCGGQKEARIKHLRMTRELEIQRLRGGAPVIDWSDLRNWAKACDDEHLAWITNIENSLSPLINAPEKLALASWLTLHKDTAEKLSNGLNSETNGPLWDKEAGRLSEKTFATLMQEAEYGADIPLVQYRTLFQSTLNKGEVREEAYLPHPNALILGTLEARMQSADLVIMGGLNEGIWPAVPNPDPWMSRNMRQQIGLALPERQIGLSAHDFQQCVAAKEVVLARAIHDGSAPTVPSRWIIRLLNLLEGLGETGQNAVSDMQKRGQKLINMAHALNKPETDVPPTNRPSPAPPVSARPDQLSVTRIETLIRDPYAIYAEKVLKLSPLSPLGKEADALERGIALHKVLQVFVDRTQNGLPDDAEALFISTAQDVLNELVPWPSIRQIWLARLERIAPWFVEEERKRRETSHPLKREIKGERTITKLSRPFTLTATADRIDLLNGTSLAIYDYKSGGLPSAKQVNAFSVQLPLEGAIAEAGGFENLGKAKVSHLELIGLGSGGKSLPLKTENDKIGDFWERLGSLIRAYENPDLGYTARTRPEMTSFVGDYDHLSRLGEWQDGETFKADPV